MTTLPQAAALRVQRPAPTNLPITAPLAAGGMFVGTPGGQSAVGMTGADVWRVIRSNLWLIILMLILGAVAGYGLNYWLKLYDAKFTAEGKLVVNGKPQIGSDGITRNLVDPQTLPLEIQYHAMMLKDPTLFTKVLQNPNDEIRNTNWFKRFPIVDDAKENLKEKLDVVSQANSKVLILSMTDIDPNSSRVIVQSIGDQYVKDQLAKNVEDQYMQNQNLQAELIAEQGKENNIKGDIADIELDLLSNDVAGGVARVSAKDEELKNLTDKVQQLELDLAAEKARLQGYKDLDEANQPIPDVETLVDNDSTVHNDQEQVSAMAMNEANADIGNMGPASDGLKHLQQYKAIVQQRLDTDRETAEQRYKSQLIDGLSQKVNQDQAEYDMMSKKIKEDQNETAHLQSQLEKLFQEQDEQKEIGTKRQSLQDQIDKIATYNSKNDVAGIDWAAPPETPDIPSFPQLPVTMSVSIVFGLALALGVAFLRELMDTTIRSPRDISRVGNINLLGMVPHEDDDPQSAGARLPVVIFEAPHSMMAEQLRQVRTRLQHSSSLDTTRSILVTSPSPGDGKSTIACNLAAGLALNGRRILLVDANFRRPELHRVFNLGNDQGFSDVLNSLDLFEHAVQETQVPNLFVLPSGPKPSNATELVESQLLVDFIERSLEEFDHLIFDSGPLLFVSETVGLAPRVDGVITVVRARTNSRGVLTRMRDTLRQVKAEHLGIVLNAVRAQGGGYYGRNIRTYYEYQNNGGAAA